MTAFKIGDQKTNAAITNGALNVRVIGTTFYPEVTNFAGLPTASDYSGKVYLCKEAQGTYWLLTKKPAGLYISNGTVWSYAGNTISMFDDTSFQIYDNSDNTKIARFQCSGITTSTARVFTWPDKDGTVAMTSDITGGASSDFLLRVPAGAADLPPVTYAEYSATSGTNGDVRTYKFDDTTEEFIEFQDHFDTSLSSTATIEIVGFPSTYAASKNVNFKLYYDAQGSNGQWDSAYATLSSGDVALSGTAQGRYCYATFSGNVGDFSDKMVRFRVSRIEELVGTTALSGDFEMTQINIRIPRA
jgi:hypothetical protein